MIMRDLLGIYLKLKEGKMKYRIVERYDGLYNLQWKCTGFIGLIDIWTNSLTGLTKEQAKNCYNQFNEEEHQKRLYRKGKKIKRVVNVSELI